MRRLLLVVLLLTALGLVGCGNKGALVHPDMIPPSQGTQQPA